MPLTTHHITAALRTFPDALLSDSFRQAMVQEASVKEEIEQPAPQPDDIALPLYPYQCQDVAWLRKRDNAILASDPGSGKTPEGIAWASLHLPCLVVCPPSVKLNWQAEILKSRPQDTVEILSGYRPYALSGANWTIITYNLLRGHMNAGAWSIWQDALQGKFTSLIGDEAHLIRNFRTAAMSKAFVKIAVQTPRCLVITGTPIVNSPVDLFPLLVCVKHRSHTYPAYVSFLQQYTHTVTHSYYKTGGKQRQVLKPGRPRNLAALKEETSQYLLRRRKAEILKDLPPKRFKNITLTLDPTHQSIYRKTHETMLRGWAQERKDPSPLHKRRVAHLGQLQRLRHLTAMGKIPTLEELLEQNVVEQRKAVIFSCFLAPLDSVYNRFQSHSLLMTGALNPEEKFAAVRQFQEDESKLFALCSTTAMGLGITLTAADLVYFLDLPWTPLEKLQAEDRLHRISQKNAVEIVHLLAKGTIDEHMLMVLERKASTAEGVMGEGSSQWAVLRELEQILAADHPAAKEALAIEIHEDF